MYMYIATVILATVILVHHMSVLLCSAQVQCMCTLGRCKRFPKLHHPGHNTCTCTVHVASVLHYSLLPRNRILHTLVGIRLLQAHVLASCTVLTHMMLIGSWVVSRVQCRSIQNVAHLIAPVHALQ